MNRSLPYSLPHLVPDLEYMISLILQGYVYLVMKVNIPLGDNSESNR